MFYRINPGMTSMPCSCKEIYTQNAAQELLHEDENFDVYGHCRYSNILYKNKKDLASKVPDTADAFGIFNQLNLHPCRAPTQKFQEMSPWRACGTVRDPHRACTAISENLSTSENDQSAERDQIQGRSSSTSEATVNSKKKGKSEDSKEAVRPYNVSKLNENSSKSNHVAGLSTSRHVSQKRTSDDEDDFKFYHFKGFWKYMREYTNRVTIVRLQQQYRIQISRRLGNSEVKPERQNLINENLPSPKKCEEVIDQVIDKPCTNRELASEDLQTNGSRLSRNQTCNQTSYSFKSPSYETCSFKAARCHPNADSRKENKSKTHKEKESSEVNHKIQMLCLRLSRANCTKDRKILRQKCTKILKKSKTRKLEIVTRPPTKSPRKNPPITRNKGQPLPRNDYSYLAKRFPSPRNIRRSPLVTKQANFQGKIVAQKCPTKNPKEYTLPVPSTKKVFLEYGPKTVHGKL